jgi:hypothetical protein
MNIGRKSINKIKSAWFQEFKNLLKNKDPKFKIDWDKFIQKTYVLNIAHREDRRVALQKKLKQIKTLKGNMLHQITWWKGFYLESEWDQNIHVKEYSFKYHWDIDPNPKWNWVTPDQMEGVKVDCSIPESNIALGHASILYDIVKNKIKVGLILEDDVDFVPGFTLKIEDIFTNQLPSDFDILYVSALPAEHGFKWEEYSKDLVKVHNGLWWFSGLIVSEKAAQKLIDAFPIVGPVDVWINYQFKDLNVYMTKCNLVDQNTGIVSDNQYSFIDKFGW